MSDWDWDWDCMLVFQRCREIKIILRSYPYYMHLAPAPHICSVEALSIPMQARAAASLIAMEPVRNIHANQSPLARPLMYHNSSSLPILKAGGVSALSAEKQRLAASSSAAVAGDVIRSHRQRCGPSHRTSMEDRPERSESMRGAR